MWGALSLRIINTRNFCYIFHYKVFRVLLVWINLPFERIFLATNIIPAGGVGYSGKCTQSIFASDVYTIWILCLLSMEFSWKLVEISVPRLYHVSKGVKFMECNLIYTINTLDNNVLQWWANNKLMYIPGYSVKVFTYIHSYTKSDL